MKIIEVIIPRTDADLKRLRELHRQGKLASGESYPTKEQLDAMPLVAEEDVSDLLEGGLGSGHFAHKGRMGKRGGSLPSASGRTLDGASVDKLQGNVAYGRKETASLEKLTQAADTWAMTLSGAEKYSLGEYMAASYRNVNTALRHPERHPTPGTMEHIQHISEALSRAALPHDVVVYRGITPGSAKGLSALAVGAEIHDKAFLSTSVSKYRAASFSGLGSDSGIVVRIRLPKGTHAALVSAMEASIGGAIKVAKGRHLDEGEILVASGARLRVTSRLKAIPWTVGNPNTHVKQKPVRVLDLEYVGGLNEGDLLEGGLGSGHFAHKGRMGKRGGSVPSSAGRTLGADDTKERQGDVAHGRKGTGSLDKLTKAADSWGSSLSDDERHALYAYMGNGYGSINKELRHPAVNQTPSITDAIWHISRSLSRAALPHDVVVYRGISGEAAKAIMKAGIPVGAEIKDKAFLSTSVSKYRAGSFDDAGLGLVVRIRLPKGAHAAFVSAAESVIRGEKAIPKDMRRSLGEGEILVASGARLRVTSGIKRVLYGSRLAVPIRTLNVDYVGSL